MGVKGSWEWLSVDGHVIHKPSGLLNGCEGKLGVVICRWPCNTLTLRIAEWQWLSVCGHVIH